MFKRYRVLVSAHACEPDKGSEPGVGWNWVKQISVVHEVWIITRKNNRESIERALAKDPMPAAHWVYFDLPRWMRFWKKRQRGVHLYYYLWQVGVYWIGRRLHKDLGFDLVHHVSFGNYWLPSLLALLPVPFVWGPLGGGESAPRTFYKTFGLRGRLYEYAREFLRWLGEHDPFVYVCSQRCRIALAKADETQNRLQSLGAKRVEIFPEAALSALELAKFDILPRRNSSVFRLVSVGNLLHLKGFHLALMAFAQFHKTFPCSEYWVIGDGPERKRLERLAHEQGVVDKTYYWGAIPREHVLKRLGDCDVLVHPSLHDSGGWVCLEAMAAGMPVICLDLGGPGFLITRGTGIKVPALNPEQAISDLATAMYRLASDPELRFRMGESCKQRVREDFTWDAKRAKIMEIYESIAGS